MANNKYKVVGFKDENKAKVVLPKRLGGMLVDLSKMVAKNDPRLEKLAADENFLFVEKTPSSLVKKS